MRIYADAPEQYLHSLTASLSRDPASFAAWHCVHVHPLQPELVNTAAIAAIGDKKNDIECDVVLCANRDIFIINTDEDHAARAKALAVIKPFIAQDRIEVNSYNLFHDFWTIGPIIYASYATADQTPSLLNDTGERVAFGEIDALHDVFAEAKKLRNARSPQRILIVEDDPVTRRVVSNILKQDHALITASNAHEAIASYMLYAPDVVFLDIGLPDHSGFAVLRQIVSSDPNAYVVMFSGNDYLDNVTAALNAGASGFVAKPFRQEQLRSYIAGSALHHRKHFS